MLTVIPTVDAEGVHGDEPFARMMLGQLDSGEQCGAPRLAEVFNNHGVAATFFLDVYEYTLYGERRLRDLAETLLNWQQDIQLHTHPAWRDDPNDHDHVRAIKRSNSFYPQNKDFMYKCSEEEQTEILSHGMNCLERWCGFRPVAHRAGGYGVNTDTYRALNNVGIRVDSSMHYGHRNSKLTWSINSVVLRDGIIEVPVTGFLRCHEITIGPLKWKRKNTFRKTDLDGCSLEDLLWFVAQAKVTGLRVVNLFMHSYSLLDFDRKYNRIWANKKKLETLENFLSAMRADPDVILMSMADFLTRFEENPDEYLSPDSLPRRYVRESAVAVASRVGPKWMAHRFARR